MTDNAPAPDWVSDNGNIVLYYADCMDILPHLSGVDAVITDPPYGDKATHAGHLSSVTLKDKAPARQALGFDGISADDFIKLSLSLTDKAARWVVFTCEWKYAHLLDEAGILVRLGIWRKPDGAPQFTGDRPGTGWEAVAICHKPGQKRWNGGGKHAFWNCSKQGKYGHPTEKPLKLFSSFVIDFTDKEELVLDPFMGSGTTGIACIRSNRRFIGIEKDRKYYEIAKERIRKELAQLRLF